MTDYAQSERQKQGNWYILTVGLPAVAETFVLASGVSLRSIGEPLTIFDLAAAGAVGFSGWSVLGSIAPACKCEIESAQDANVVPGYDKLNRAWLASTLLVLRGYTNHLCVACSRYSWRKIAGHQRRHSERFRKQIEEEGVEAATFTPEGDLPRFTGQLLDFHLKVLSDGKIQPTEVSRADADWVRSHYDIFNALAAESESFSFALEAAMDWRYATGARSAVSRLWAGIEAMLGISSELVYRISLLSASLTRPRGAQRTKRFAEIKELYGMRSKIVHGDKLSEEKIHHALAMSYELLRELLLLAIERGQMLGEEDFDEAVFH